MHVIEYFYKKSKIYIICIGYTAFTLLAFADSVFNYKIEFEIFYLMPIIFVTWFVGRKPGIIFSILATILLFLVDMSRVYPYLAAPTLYINWLVRIVSFTLIVNVMDGFSKENMFTKIDSLTGIPNKQHFYDLATIELERSKRYNTPFTLVYLDIDSLKDINNEYSYKMGDEIISLVADKIKSNVRVTDILGRVKGDEFVIYFTETGYDKGVITTRKIKKILSDAMAVKKLNVTFSMGVATFIKCPGNTDEMLRLVNNLMYEGKIKGRDIIKHDLIEK